MGLGADACLSQSVHTCLSQSAHTCLGPGAQAARAFGESLSGLPGGGPRSRAESSSLSFHLPPEPGIPGGPDKGWGGGARGDGRPAPRGARGRSSPASQTGLAPPICPEGSFIEKLCVSFLLPGPPRGRHGDGGGRTQQAGNQGGNGEEAREVSAALRAAGAASFRKRRRAGRTQRRGRGRAGAGGVAAAPVTPAPAHVAGARSKSKGGGRAGLPRRGGRQEAGRRSRALRPPGPRPARPPGPAPPPPRLLSPGPRWQRAARGAGSAGRTARPPLARGGRGRGLAGGRGRSQWEGGKGVIDGLPRAVPKPRPGCGGPVAARRPPSPALPGPPLPAPLSSSRLGWRPASVLARAVSVPALAPRSRRAPTPA